MLLGCLWTSLMGVDLIVDDQRKNEGKDHNVKGE